MKVSLRFLVVLMVIRLSDAIVEEIQEMERMEFTFSLLSDSKQMTDLIRIFVCGCDGFWNATEKSKIVVGFKQNSEFFFCLEVGMQVFLYASKVAAVVGIFEIKCLRGELKRL